MYSIKQARALFSDLQGSTVYQENGALIPEMSFSGVVKKLAPYKSQIGQELYDKFLDIVCSAQSNAELEGFIWGLRYGEAIRMMVSEEDSRSEADETK